MCSSCEPGSAQLASWLLHDLDLSNLPNTPAPSIRAKGNENSKIFYNGTILTMAEGAFSPVDALVVKGDTITYAGSLDKAKEAAGPGAEPIDLDGRSLSPGFIEPHLHLIMTALADYFLLNLSPLNGVNTSHDAIDRIKDQVNRNLILGGTKWVAGYGYDPSRLQDHRDLTRDRLDGISKKIPIYVLNQSAHVAYVNSKALEEAGVTAENVANNPQFQRDKKTGQLTGLLFEQAVGYVAKYIPLPKAQDLLDYCSNTLTTWVSKGCTTVFDAGIGSIGPTDSALLSNLPASPMRIYGALSNNIVTSLSSIIKQPPFKLAQIEIIAIKFWADGSTQGFTAALNQPYCEDRPGWACPRGTQNYPSSAALQTLMDPWLKAGFQLVVHSNGDAATDLVLNAYEALFQANPNRKTSIHHRIEHFTVTEPEQLLRAKTLGLAVSHTIGHVNYWGSTFKSYVLGCPRAERIDPLHSDEAAGLLWSLHSDSPITPVHPLLYVKTATTRELYPSGGGTLGSEERVDLQTALRGVTIYPATQLGIADKVGTLEAGKKADFVVLDQDPRAVKLSDLDQLVVEQTWIGGSLEYSNKK